MKVSFSNSIPKFQSNERSLDLSTRQNNDVAQTQIVVRDENDLDKETIKTAVSNMNDFIEPVITNLKFVFHEDLHEYYVTIINPVTDEVIREIPPKKLLDMYAAMAEYIGLLVDEKI